jgi:hypothetical protein
MTKDEALEVKQEYHLPKIMNSDKTGNFGLHSLMEDTTQNTL